MATYTVETRCSTMARAIDAFLASRESSPYDEVYLFGQSQGGGLVPRIYDELSVAKAGKTNLTYLELDGGHLCWVDNLEALAWMAE